MTAFAYHMAHNDDDYCIEDLCNDVIYLITVKVKTRNVLIHSKYIITILGFEPVTHSDGGSALSCDRIFQVYYKRYSLRPDGDGVEAEGYMGQVLESSWSLLFK